MDRFKGDYMMMVMELSDGAENKICFGGGARGGPAFCRFYNIFALLSTIYNKNLNTIYIYTKNVKSTIYNLKILNDFPILIQNWSLLGPILAFLIMS